MAIMRHRKKEISMGLGRWEKCFMGEHLFSFPSPFLALFLSKEVPILPITNLSVNVISLLCNENSVTKDGHFLTASSILILFPFILSYLCNALFPFLSVDKRTNSILPFFKDCQLRDLIKRLTLLLLTMKFLPNSINV